MQSECAQVRHCGLLRIEPAQCSGSLCTIREVHGQIAALHGVDAGVDLLFVLKTNFVFNLLLLRFLSR